MYVAQRTVLKLHGLLKRFGPSTVKKALWNREFLTGHWDFIDDTAGDCVYQHLEKYAAQGAVLDLGCGPGNTANEMASDAYQTYLGVDISEAALDKGRRRSAESGRGRKNRFEFGDLLSYKPTEQFDVILFRESLYHVPSNRVKGMLDRYSSYLKEGGVFIVRLVTWRGSDGKRRTRLKAMTDTIETNFKVLENHQYGQPGPTVIVFRPRQGPENRVAGS